MAAESVIDMSIIRKIAAYVLLVGVYGFTWLIAILGGLIPRRRWKPTGRIMVTGTFHNPNWYLSHLTPLSRSGVKEVILVVDEPALPLDKVRFVCPPRWAARLLSRAGAKAIWMILAGLHYRPDLYMGYHLGPGPCSALVAARIWGRPACYQMTGGPVVIIGGGVDAVESIGGALGRPSRLIEALAMKVVKQFDLVVVRGTKAREFLAARGVKESVTIITGSVNGRQQLPSRGRDIHLIYVGRLSPIKQVHQFIAVVDRIRVAMPDVRAVIVGDGPLRGDLRARAEQLKVSEHIEFPGRSEDVGGFLARSRVFVLTSKSEGLSIAMVEAMAAGVVPVVADVGELSDLVVNGVNGYLITPNCIEEYASRILSLLQDNSLWARCSCCAIDAAKAQCNIDVVTAKWRHHLHDVVARASGHGT
jgi:glycosyltransferase involved in cell wall biosynthesis